MRGLFALVDSGVTFGLLIRADFACMCCSPQSLFTKRQPCDFASNIARVSDVVMSRVICDSCDVTALMRELTGSQFLLSMR